MGLATVAGQKPSCALVCSLTCNWATIMRRHGQQLRLRRLRREKAVWVVRFRPGATLYRIPFADRCRPIQAYRMPYCVESRV
jgi:hypothetical protein